MIRWVHNKVFLFKRRKDINNNPCIISSDAKGYHRGFIAMK